MIYTGFADEAGSTLSEQIAATKKLGWHCIDIRFVDGVNFTDVTDEKFEECFRLLQKEGIQVPCFGSAVGNSGKSAENPVDVDYSIQALARALPRMKKLGTRYIRGMAFSMNRGKTLEENEAIIFPVMKTLTNMCEKEGMVYLCENCGGYAGDNYTNLLRLSAYLNSPAFKIVYDTGNPIGSMNHTEEGPRGPQDAYDFYQSVKHLIGYMHIKDQKVIDGGSVVRTFPGEGQAQVERIIKDLLMSGYQGVLSIEPHMHNGFDGYVEYGRRLMAIVDAVK